MMMMHSHDVSEDHNMQHSALQIREPPSLDLLVSTSDEGAISHRSQDCWGNTIETKQLEQCVLSSRILLGCPKTRRVGR